MEFASRSHRTRITSDAEGEVLVPFGTEVRVARSYGKVAGKLALITLHPHRGAASAGQKH
jgi:hypothetical protein